MPSLVPGYSYDIFISYRQKDNKYDGWVTEFVNNLRKELEATFKEDISIYFDENPHDGLLETHDVDESLKDKLKCLIFIPIISQTYCDPKSFAWKHEFLVFKKLASEDEFGLKAKLNNGNVASRILPVRIHELYVEDMNTIEAELAGPLRAIDFIYKSPGVNRPLTAQDNPDKNLDKTLYRDQINKVANAVKELIYALQNRPTSTHGKNNQGKPVAKLNRLWLLSFIPLMLIGALIFSFWREEEVSIAVLPFRNLSQVTELQPLGIGMASEIRTKLSLAKRFKFISALQATLPYENTSKSIPEIGNELGVSYILSGLIQQRGDLIKVETELIDAKNGREIWSLSMERELTDINLLQIEIAEKVIKQFSSSLTIAEKNKLTSNVVAYAHYAKGNLLLDSSYGDSTDIEASYKLVIEQYEKAISLDSMFMDAWADLIGVETFIYRAEEDGERRKNRKEKIDRYCQYFKEHFPNGWQKDLVQGHYAYRVSNERARAIEYFQQVLDVNPENIHALYALSTINRRKLELDLSLKYAVRLIEQNPSHGGNWMNLSSTLSIGGEHEKAARAAIKGWNLSHSKNFGTEVIVKSMLVGLPESDLPVDLKEKLKDDWIMFSLLINRDWVALKKFAREKSDYGLLSEVYLHLGKIDSALYYWNEQPDPQKGKDSVDYFVIHRDLDNALRIFRKANQDKLDVEFEKLEAAIRMEGEINIYISLSEVEKATELLQELSNRYPQYNNYLSYKSFMSDNLKDYPPFQKLLGELMQRKSMISVRELIEI